MICIEVSHETVLEWSSYAIVKRKNKKKKEEGEISLSRKHLQIKNRLAIGLSICNDTRKDLIISTSNIGITVLLNFCVC